MICLPLDKIWKLDFSQKFCSGDLLFFYASSENDVVVLIHPTLDSADTLEAEIPYEEVVDTMGDDMMDEMK